MDNFDKGEVSDALDRALNKVSLVLTLAVVRSGEFVIAMIRCS